MRARQTELQSQSRLLKFLKGEAGKAPFTIADIATGLAGGSVELISKYRKDAARFADRARVARPDQGGGPIWRTTGRHGRCQPQGHGYPPRPCGQPSVTEGPGRPHGQAKQDRAGFRRVPVVGAAITAAGVTYEIRQGADPGKAITSGAVSFGASVATGVAIGAMVGGPVGVVAGAIVGAGIGAVTDFAIDEWVYDAGKDFAGDAIGWAKDLFD